MREHIGLFRGKRIDNGEWAEGYYGVFKGDHDIFVPFTEEEEKRNEGHFVSAIGGLWYKVDPDTVGECCGGLRDKNGKLIFEGDILDCGDRIVVVVWHRACGTWDSNFVRYIGKQCSNGINNSDWKYRATIIGNAIDNPELLKGGEG